MTEPFNAASGITHMTLVPNVPIAIPAIASSTNVVVTTPLAIIRPGDLTVLTLAAGSAQPPTAVGPLGSGFCSTAGTLSIKYTNENGGLAANSAATNITANVLVISALP